jgi:hypothetical protein
MFGGRKNDLELKIEQMDLSFMSEDKMIRDTIEAFGEIEIDII